MTPVIHRQDKEKAHPIALAMGRKLGAAVACLCLLLDSITSRAVPDSVPAGETYQALNSFGLPLLLALWSAAALISLS